MKVAVTEFVGIEEADVLCLVALLGQDSTRQLIKDYLILN